VHLGPPARRTARLLAGVLLAAALLPAMEGTPEAQGSTPGKILCRSFRDGNGEIYIMNPDGTDQIRLTDNLANEQSPALSPDGTEVVFVSDRGGGDRELFVMDADGSDVVKITDDTSDDFYPTWSPDGTRIAFVTSRDGNEEIYVMDADGTDPVNVSNSPGSGDFDPAWSPDGSRIAFVSDRGGVVGPTDIFVMDADGSDQVDVSRDTGQDFAPSWSPDASRIAFRNDRSGDFDIWVMNANGSGQTNLTNDPLGLDRQPAWSPDGTMIAFASNREGQYDVFTMNADGSNQTNITPEAGEENQPDWGTAALPPIGFLEDQAALSSNTSITTKTIPMTDVPELTGLTICAVGEISVTTSVQLTGKTIGMQVRMDDSRVLDPGSIRFLPDDDKAGFSFTFIDRARTNSGTDLHVLDLQWSSPLGKLITFLRGNLSVQYEQGVCP
jgi:Tol biopolymer transport system component